MLGYINRTVDAIYCIENSVIRRKQTLERWKKWHMANTGHWYYAYSIDGNSITIHDAYHEQNMK